jgi:hypothetical protein
MKNMAITLPLHFVNPFCTYPARLWFAEGHQIVAIIAADDLIPTARSHATQILGVPDDKSSVEKTMAAASISPDTEFRVGDKATAQWHFIDICLQDNKSDFAGAMPGRQLRHGKNR